MSEPTKAGREQALADLKDTISDCCDMEEAYRRGYQAGRESMRSGWRKVEDGMPNEEGKYYVWLVPHKPQPSSLDPEDSIFLNFKPYAREVNTYLSREGKLRFNCGAVEFPTHWMPLPLAPGKESE